MDEKLANFAQKFPFVAPLPPTIDIVAIAITYESWLGFLVPESVNDQIDLVMAALTEQKDRDRLSFVKCGYNELEGERLALFWKYINFFKECVTTLTKK